MVNEKLYAYAYLLENENRLRHLENIIYQMNNRTIKKKYMGFYFFNILGMGNIG